MKELISVIVPVYNVEKYLDECVDSVIKQSYKNLEIILIDDASTDNSGSICDYFASKDNRVRVIHKEKHSGVSDSRNIGLNIATGKYIYLIDSDDYISKDDTLERMSKLMTEEVDIIGSFYFEKNEKGDKYLYIESSIIELTPIEAVRCIYDTKKYRYNFTVPHNKLYRKELFEGIEYPFGKIHEDEFITYKLYLKSRKIVILGDTTYAYRRRGNSIINSAYTVDRLVVFEAYKERMEILTELKEYELVDKTKFLYFYNLLFHKYMLLKNNLREYDSVKADYKNFIKNNPKYRFKIIRYKFIIKELIFRFFGR